MFALEQETVRENLKIYAYTVNSDEDLVKAKQYSLSEIFNDNQKLPLENKVDILIVDPPRSGIHKKTIKKIIEINPIKIIYVSCNPSTQARDVKELLLEGYAT